MITYHKQFERDFAATSQQVIDATEGGLPKEGTTAMPLAGALQRYATRPAPRLPIPPRKLDQRQLVAAEQLIQRRIEEVAELRRLSTATIPLLKKMARHLHDRDHANRLFAKIDANRRRVDELGDAFKLVNDLNTLGAFKRARSDRAIEHESQTEIEEQARRIERDLENLNWLTQACDEALDIFHAARHRLGRCNEKLKMQNEELGADAGDEGRSLARTEIVR
jgi:hypothetical protein